MKSFLLNKKLLPACNKKNETEKKSFLHVQSINLKTLASQYIN